MATLGRAFPVRSLVAPHRRPIRPAILGAPPQINFRTGNVTDGGASSISTINSAFSSNNAGNLIVVCVGWLDTAGTITANTPTDTAGNTYHLAAPKASNATQQYAVSIFYAFNVAQQYSTNTVTATLSAAGTFVRLHIHEYIASNGNLFLTDPFDVTNFATGSGTALASAAATTTANGELIVGFGAAGSGVITAGSGFVLREPPTGNLSTGSDDQIQTTAGSVSATATTSVSSQWVMQVATFKDATAAAPPPVPLQTARHQARPQVYLRRQRAAAVVSAPAAPATPTFVGTTTHARARASYVRRRTPAAVPPMQAVPPPVYPPVFPHPRVKPATARRRPVAQPPSAQEPIWQAARARLRIARLPRGRVTAPIPMQVILPPVYPPQPARPHPRAVRAVRGRTAAPIPAQAAPPPPIYIPAQARRAVTRLAALRRARQSTPADVPPPPAAARTRPRTVRVPHGHTTQVVPAQVAVPPPAYPPTSTRTRIRGVRLGRGRVAVPVPTQTLPAAPAYVPGRARQSVARLAAVRRARAVPGPQSQAAAPSGVRRRVQAPRLPQAHRTAAPPAPQPAPPFTARVRLRIARLLPRRAVPGWLVGQASPTTPGSASLTTLAAAPGPTSVSAAFGASTSASYAHPTSVSAAFGAATITATLAASSSAGISSSSSSSAAAAIVTAAAAGSTPTSIAGTVTPGTGAGVGTASTADATGSTDTQGGGL